MSIPRGSELPLCRRIRIPLPRLLCIPQPLLCRGRDQEEGYVLWHDRHFLRRSPRRLRWGTPFNRAHLLLQGRGESCKPPLLGPEITWKGACLPPKQGSQKFTLRGGAKQTGFTKTTSLWAFFVKTIYIQEQIRFISHFPDERIHLTALQIFW